MNPALAETRCLFSLSYPATAVLFPSDLQFHIPLRCLLGVMLIFVVSQWLSEEIREIPMHFLFLTHFLFLFPSSLLVLGRGKLVLIPKDFGL